MEEGIIIIYSVIRFSLSHSSSIGSGSDSFHLNYSISSVFFRQKAQQHRCVLFYSAEEEGKKSFFLLFHVSPHRKINTELYLYRIVLLCEGTPYGVPIDENFTAVMWKMQCNIEMKKLKISRCSDFALGYRSLSVFFFGIQKFSYFY